MAYLRGIPTYSVEFDEINRAGKSGWGGSDRIAGAGRWLPVSTYYLTSIVPD